MPFPADYDFTERLALPSPQLDEDADGPLAFSKINEILDPAVIYDEGPIDQRPDEPYIVGAVYRSTDEGANPYPVYLCIGAAWMRLNPTQEVDGPVDEGTLRTLGDGEFQALPGDHPTTTNVRVPTDNSVTIAKAHTSIKPSTGAAGADEALRALGTQAGRAAAGIHATQHRPGQADPLDMSYFNLTGTFSNRPAASAANRYLLYWAYDTKQFFFNRTGSDWELVSSSGVAVYHLDLPTAEESQAMSASFAYMPTPDRIQDIDIPADATVFISYHTLWKGAQTTHRIAPFVDSDQIQAMEGGVVEGQLASGTNYYPAHTGSSDMLVDGTITAALPATPYVAGGGGTQQGTLLGPITGIAAGEHEIGVKFKATSGTALGYRKGGALTVWVYTP